MTSLKVNRTWEALGINRSRFLRGTVSKINTDAGTLDAMIHEGGWTGSSGFILYEDIPISYKCQERTSNDLEYKTSSAFKKNDPVLIEWYGGDAPSGAETGPEIGEVAPAIEDLRAIGFYDNVPRLCRANVIAVVYRAFVAFYDCSAVYNYCPETYPKPLVKETWEGGFGSSRWIYFELHSQWDMQDFIRTILGATLLSYGIAESVVHISSVAENQESILGVATSPCTCGDMYKGSESAPAAPHETLRTISRTASAYSELTAWDNWAWNDYQGGSTKYDPPSEQQPEEDQPTLSLEKYSYDLVITYVGAGNITPVVIAPPTVEPGEDPWVGVRTLYIQNAVDDAGDDWPTAFEPAWAWGTSGSSHTIKQCNSYSMHHDEPALPTPGQKWFFDASINVCEGVGYRGQTSYRGYAQNSTQYKYHGITRYASLTGDFTGWQKHGLLECGIGPTDPGYITYPTWEGVPGPLPKIVHPTEANVRLHEAQIINRSNGTAGLIVGQKSGDSWNWSASSGWSVDPDIFRKSWAPVNWRGQYYTYGQFIMYSQRVVTPATAPVLQPPDPYHPYWEWVMPQMETVQISMRGFGHRTDRYVYYNLTSQGELDTLEFEQDLVQKYLNGSRCLHTPQTMRVIVYPDDDCRTHAPRYYDFPMGSEDAYEQWDHGQACGDWHCDFPYIDVHWDTAQSREHFSQFVNKKVEGGVSSWLQGKMCREALIAFEIQSTFGGVWRNNNDTFPLPTGYKVCFHSASKPEDCTEIEWAENRVSVDSSDWITEFFLEIMHSSTMTQPMKEWVESSLHGDLDVYYNDD